MHTCPVCFEKFPIEFIYKSHLSKCEKNEKITSLVPTVGVGVDILRDMYEKQKELELRIHKLENIDNKKHRITDLPLPINDYMLWIQSIEITVEDKMNAFYNMIGVITDLLTRNRIKYSGIFYKWKCGKTLDACKMLVGKKIAGSNGIILGYKWYYMKSNDIVQIVDYFCNIFKMELIDWYNKNENNIKNKIDNNHVLYERYYDNVILINERLVIKEIKTLLFNL